MTVPDPAALFRDLLGQWESLANRHGADWLKSGEAARAMGAATSAGANAQAAVHDGMARALAAANMPSRADFAALSERVAQVDARLERMEAMLRSMGAAAPMAERPKPPRTKQPKVEG